VLSALASVVFDGCSSTDVTGARAPRQRSVALMVGCTVAGLSVLAQQIKAGQ
jgi:hypothetical protein